MSIFFSPSLLGLIHSRVRSRRDANRRLSTYQQMTLTQRAAFVTEKAREISRKISGNDYEFTTAFEMEIQKAVDMYARRIGNNAGDSPGKGDARFVFERGQTVAPTLIRTFKAHNVSPLNRTLHSAG